MTNERWPAWDTVQSNQHFILLSQRILAYIYRRGAEDVDCM